MRLSSRGGKQAKAKEETTRGTAGCSHGDQSFWLIHGVKYDLTTFMREHPGGEWPLLATKNLDCTLLFESSHLFIAREKLEKMRARQRKLLL